MEFRSIMYKDPSQFWEQVDIEGPVSTSTNSFCNKNQPFWNKHMISLKSNLTAVCRGWLPEAKTPRNSNFYVI